MFGHIPAVRTVAVVVVVVLVVHILVVHIPAARTAVVVALVGYYRTVEPPLVDHKALVQHTQADRILGKQGTYLGITKKN